MAAGICAGYIFFDEKKDTTKIGKVVLDVVHVQQWSSARTQTSSQVTYRGWFRIQEFH